MGYSCRIVLDSYAPSGSRLTTFEVTFPRVVLAEFNTHRLFSRNSASSRAIPVEKMIRRVQEDPFIPIYWGKNQKGMQAKQELEPHERRDAERQWLQARDYSAARAQALFDAGVHKQITNRLLEPFLYHTVIVTATEWGNWDGLRNNEEAQPEIRQIASAMREAYKAGTPQKLDSGAWHLPLVTGVDEEELRAKGFGSEQLAQVSCARCARVSYLTHDGKRDPDEDLNLYERLFASGHMSPLEHAAVALTEEEWTSHARDMAARWIKDRIPVGNFWGWRQFRKMVPSEHDFSKRA